MAACCGMPLQKATKWIAVLNIVLLAIATVIVAFSLGMSALAFFAIDHQPSTNEIQAEAVYNGTTEEDQTGDIIKRDGEIYVNMKLMLKLMIQYGTLVNVLSVFVMVYALVMSVELLKGAQERNQWRCNAWLRVQIAQMVASILITPIVIAVSATEYNFWALLLATPIGWIVNLYFMYIVYSFIKEIRNETSDAGAEVRWTKA